MPAWPCKTDPAADADELDTGESNSDGDDAERFIAIGFRRAEPRLAGEVGVATSIRVLEPTLTLTTLMLLTDFAGLSCTVPLLRASSASCSCAPSMIVRSVLDVAAVVGVGTVGVDAVAEARAEAGTEPGTGVDPAGDAVGVFHSTCDGPLRSLPPSAPIVLVEPERCAGCFRASSGVFEPSEGGAGAVLSSRTIRRLLECCRWCVMGNV